MTIDRQTSHIVFIDESGDPGIANLTCSNFFVMVMVIFEEDGDVSFADEIIDNIKKKTNHKTEFKFSKTDIRKREIFFNEISCINFKVEAILVDKNIIYSKRFQQEPIAFYNYILRELISNSRTELFNPIIMVDGKKNKSDKQNFSTYLRKYQKFKKVLFKDSKSSNLIQMADMIAGGIHSYYKCNKDNCIFTAVNDKIHIWDFQ